MADSTADVQLHYLATPEVSSASNRKAVVIGLYGLPGSGKTYLLNQLKQEFGKSNWAFYEGSEMIDSVVPGGLNAFQLMEEQEREHWRRCAMDAIGDKLLLS